MSQSSCPSPGPKQTNIQTYHQRHKTHSLELSFKGKPREQGKWDCAVFFGSPKDFWSMVFKRQVTFSWKMAHSGSLDPVFLLPLSIWKILDFLGSGLDEKGEGGAVPAAGVPGRLASPGKDRPTPLHPVRGLRALPRGRRIPSGNNKCWRILWRGLWLPHCHPLGPLEPYQGGQSTMLHITLLCILVPVDTVEFCCLHSDNHALPLLHVTAGDLKTLAQICWSSHSEVMGILSCISHRGNWSMQRSFIQGSGAADNGEEGLHTPVIFLTSHPNIHEFSYWVLVSLNLWLPLILKSQDTKPDS